MATSTEPDETRLNISESADRITLKTKVVRGNATRDQDKVTVKVKGDDPEKAAGRLSATLDALEDEGVADALRDTQPEGQ